MANTSAPPDRLAPDERREIEDLLELIDEEFEPHTLDDLVALVREVLNFGPLALIQLKHDLARSGEFLYATRISNYARSHEARDTDQRIAPHARHVSKRLVGPAIEKAEWRLMLQISQSDATSHDRSRHAKVRRSAREELARRLGVSCSKLDNWQSPTSTELPAPYQLNIIFRIAATARKPVDVLRAAGFGGDGLTEQQIRKIAKDAKIPPDEKRRK